MSWKQIQPEALEIKGDIIGKCSHDPGMDPRLEKRKSYKGYYWGNW